MSATNCTAHPPKLSELGSDLLRLTSWQRFAAIAAPLFAFAAFWGFAGWSMWPLAVLSLVALSFLTYGSTSHDLVHGNLGLSRRWNDRLLCAIELISLRSGHAYQAAHLHHHARFPHEDDIEAEAARQSCGRAVLEGFVFQFRIYAWALRNSPARRRWIMAEGIGVSAIIAASIAAWPWTISPAIYVGLMIAGSWVIPLVTSYIPHNPQAGDVLHQTRLFRGWLFRIVACDHLYHLEHHLYPAVPHANWPRLAKRLDPWFQTAGVKPVRCDLFR